jgi:hypothetical protein
MREAVARKFFFRADILGWNVVNAEIQLVPAVASH